MRRFVEVDVGAAGLPDATEAPFTYILHFVAAALSKVSVRLVHLLDAKRPVGDDMSGELLLDS